MLRPARLYTAAMSIDQRPLAIFLMGPTASGKTALACDLSERFPVDLISVDSALVYRSLDIGTAKPDPHTLARYPHGLVDVRDPSDPYSAADFSVDARALMGEISARGRVPLLVGGTGLYFRALQQGLSTLPAADPLLRERLVAEAKDIGWPAMHVRLQACDPTAASRIDPNDVQRLQRALEVFELTGTPLSTLQVGHASRVFPWRVLKLSLMPQDRRLLHERIARRFDKMLKAGFFDEVVRLRGRGDLHPDLPAMRAVGYRQAWQHLEGTIDSATFRDHSIFATRQLAKRQITWLRSEAGARMFEPDDEALTRRAADAVDLFFDS